MIDIAPGILLISDPFLMDPSFRRTVVLLCEHRQEGSFGFVVNKTHDQELGDLMAHAEGIRFPVYDGGPVQKDSLHFLHTAPALIGGGIELTDGIYWGGDFEEAITRIRNKQLRKKDIRFFLGYSGWGEGQLAGEMREKSWITREANQPLVFQTETVHIWKEALQDMGGEYRQMINYPINPQLN